MRFALITDVHLGKPAAFAGKLRKLSLQAGALTREFVGRMNASDRPDLAINLGDVIEDDTPELDRQNYQHFLECLNELEAPVLHVAGNHDSVNLSDAELAALWQQSEPLHYTRVVKGLRFVVLRSVETKDVSVNLPREQFDWLDDTLRASAEPAVVLIHHPLGEVVLTGNRWFEKAPHICRVAERRELRQIIERSGKVKAVFNGHAHFNQLTVHNGIPYVTLQSLIENLDDDAPGRAARAHAVCDFDRGRLHVHVRGEHEMRYQFDP